MSLENYTAGDLRSLADNVKPLDPKGLAKSIEVVAMFFAILGGLVVALRVFVRMGYSGALRKAWGLDDYLAVAGFIPFVPCCVYTVLLTYYGMGTRDRDFPEGQNFFYTMRTTESVMNWQINYIFASTLTKCSIGVTCLRLDKRKRIRWPIIGNMAVMVLVSVGGIIFVLVNCVPIEATWNPKAGYCHQPKGNEYLSYVVAAAQLVTDWVCAAMPAIIVAGLQMSRRKKISVSIILGLGVLASIATCVRMPYFKYYDTAKYPNDFLYNLSNVFLWSIIEAGLGVVCCSLPPLRVLFSYYRGTSHNKTSEANSGVKLRPMNGNNNYLASVHAKCNGQWDRLEDDNSGRGIVMKTTEVEVSHARYEQRGQ